MQLKTVQEGSASIFIYHDVKISKELPVFYNPEMTLNRDLAIRLLRQFPPLTVCDPLAGTGIRSIRFAKELRTKSITANDTSTEAYHLIKKNAQRNHAQVTVTNEDASTFLLRSKGFDYIDLDVFGSPHPFLDAAVRRLSRSGILAVTATDTAALAGTARFACLRKYWAEPLRNELMHEVGMRILIRKIQLIGAQYEKALVPLFCHATKHYLRAYLQNVTHPNTLHHVLSYHTYLQHCSHCFTHAVREYPLRTCSCRSPLSTAGPLWVGPLWDARLARAMEREENTGSQRTQQLVSTITQEALIGTVGFYDIHEMCHRLRRSVPPTASIVTTIIKRGYLVSPTHFRPTGLRTSMPAKELVMLLKKMT